MIVSGLSVSGFSLSAEKSAQPQTAQSTCLVTYRYGVLQISEVKPKVQSQGAVVSFVRWRIPLTRQVLEEGVGAPVPAGTH